MADIYIKAKWSDDGKYVTLSKDDWEKILHSLEKNGSVYQTFHPSLLSSKLGWTCAECGCSNLENDLLCGFCDSPRQSTERKPVL